jgi:hypothetical protein
VLAELMDDRDSRERLARGARAAGARLPSWDDAAAKHAAALERLASPQ